MTAPAGAHRESLRAWMQLLRPPNLFTVPGDPLAGFFLAQSLTPNPVPFTHAPGPMLAVTLLYMAGLISNDLADRCEDARERPSRPIPSGRITPRAAAYAFAGLTAAGIFVAAFSGGPAVYASLLLTGLILLYNFAAKSVPVIGPLVMGACRGVGLLLGALPQTPHLTGTVASAALITTLFIAAVTWIALRETRTEPAPIKRWAPAGVLLIAWILFYGTHPLCPLSMLPALVSVALAAHAGHLLGPHLNPTRTPRLIGSLIRNLLWIQAAFCAYLIPQGYPAAVLLILLYPLSKRISKRFYAS